MSHDSEEWYKIEEKWFAVSKMIKNLVNFDLSTWNSQSSHSDWFLICKVFKVKTENEKSWHWKVMQNLKKSWLVVWRMTRSIWKNFHQSTWKSQNWGLDGILLSKVENGFLLTKGYNIWVKKVQKSFVWWFWKLMQNLKVNWLLFFKITWGICQTFTGWKIAISL